MAITPEGYIERLTAAANKKYALVRDILEITRRQSEAISEDGIDTMEKLVAEKQAKIDAVNKADDEFNVYFQRLKQELKVKSLDESGVSSIVGIRELQSVVGQVMAAMEEIEGIEAENNARVRQLLDSVGGEIRKINQGRKLNSAYNPRPAQSASYFMDKKK